MTRRVRPRLCRLGVAALLALGACHGTEDPGAKGKAFCRDLVEEGCVRAFDCVPPAQQTATFTAMYQTSLDACLAAPDPCAQFPVNCPKFDADAGTTCLSEFTNQTCAELLFVQNGDPTIALPTSCGAVCPP